MSRGLCPVGFCPFSVYLVTFVRLIFAPVSDLDLDPMTLIYELGLDIRKTRTCTCAKNEDYRERLLKVRARTGKNQNLAFFMMDRQTDRHTHRQTRPKLLPQPH